MATKATPAKKPTKKPAATEKKEAPVENAELAELQAALADARADARAARDEVARLNGENEALRARIDRAALPSAKAPAAATAGPPGDSLERARREANLARSEAAELRDTLDRERIAAAKSRNDAQLAARAAAAQLDEARAETARASANAREAKLQLKHALDEAAKLREGAG
jgi:hypothetical protein